MLFDSLVSDISCREILTCSKMLNAAQHPGKEGLKGELKKYINKNMVFKSSNYVFYILYIPVYFLIFKEILIIKENV